MNSTIAVMGCGWLGLPLARTLVKENYVVHGSTTSSEKISILEAANILPFVISLSEDKIVGNTVAFLSNVEVLIINIPPKLRGGGTENYVKKIQLLHRAIQKSKVRKVIFVSSISVYGSVEGEVTEETRPLPVTESGKQLLAAEKIFQNDPNLQTTIIRFGGLIGPNRHPITRLSGRQNLPNGNAPVNLIHLTDCIRIITAILQFNWWNELLNGVYPAHPNKKNYYTNVAKLRNIQAPDYKDNKIKIGRKIVPKRLLYVKKFEFTASL